MIEKCIAYKTIFRPYEFNQLHISMNAVDGFNPVYPWIFDKGVLTWLDIEITLHKVIPIYEP